MKSKPKVHSLHLSHAHHAGGSETHVSGMLQSPQGRMLPFHYTLGPTDPPEVHDRFIQEYHEKGEIWEIKNKQYDAWCGSKFTVDGVDVFISVCGICLFGPNDWRVVVGWTENGTYRESSWRYRHPGEAKSLQSVKDHVTEQARKRAIVNDNVAAHRDAVKSLAAKHGAHVTGV